MRRFARGVVSLVLVVVMFAFAAATVSPMASAVSKEGRVVIDFWSFWGSASRRPVIEKIVDDFNNSQEKIFVQYTYLPWGDIWTKNLASIAAGNPADVIINDINTVAHRARNNQNTNLSKYITPGFKEQYFPELWKTVLYNGEPYAVPFNTDTRVLFYNKKLFREAGLDPEKAPKTWAELWDYANKLDKKAGSMYERIGFYPQFGVGAETWLLNAEGISWFDGAKVAINTPVKVEGLRWLKKWSDKYGQNNINIWKAEFGNKQSHPFLNGRLAMFVDIAGFYTQIRDYSPEMEFGVALLPEMTPDSGHWSWGGGFVAEIPKGSKHPAEAFEFIKYLTGAKAQEYWAVKNFDNIANIAAAKAASNDSSLGAAGQMVYKMAVKNMDTSLLVPVPLYAPDYTNLINPQLDAVFLGKATPEEALAKAQKLVEDLVNTNKNKK